MKYVSVNAELYKPSQERAKEMARHHRATSAMAAILSRMWLDERNLLYCIEPEIIELLLDQFSCEQRDEVRDLLRPVNQEAKDGQEDPAQAPE